MIATSENPRLQATFRALAAGIEMHDLAGGVHTGIRAACTGNFDGFIGDFA